jgi:collagenase-like PrtC family protease
LTLGPVFFNWSGDRLRDFYYRIADEAPVDSVSLGEVVCCKRTALTRSQLDTICRRLQSAGKQVVQATPALVTSERERALVRDLIDDAGDRLVEANDVGALALLAGRPHAVGPFVNVYNEGTLDLLSRRGTMRVTLPVELPSASLAALAGAAADSPVELEAGRPGRRDPGRRGVPGGQRHAGPVLRLRGFGRRAAGAAGHGHPAISAVAAQHRHGGGG